MIFILEPYITNLGRYNEGHLDGEFLKLPATTEEVQALLKRIHIDGVRYEEIFITDYETDIDGLYKLLGEYESIDELNYLAFLLNDMDESEVAKYAAAVEHGGHVGSVKDLINLAQNLDCYEFYPDIVDEDGLGWYYIEDMCALDVPGHLRNYINYEAYGRDIAMDEDGSFIDSGYIVENGGSFIEHYNGRDDIPDECRIFAYPEPEKSIKKAIETFSRIASEAPATDRPRPAIAER